MSSFQSIKAFLAPVLSVSASETSSQLPRDCVHQPPFLSEEVPAAPPRQRGRGAEHQRLPVQRRGPQGRHAVQPVHAQERREQVMCQPGRAGCGALPAASAAPQPFNGWASQHGPL